MSAITTSSGTTCPSHQESAWRVAEARQEKEVVRKAIVASRSCICLTHLQTFSVSTVLDQKASNVKQSSGASAKLLGVAHHHIGQEEYYKKKATCLVS